MSIQVEGLHKSFKTHQKEPTPRLIAFDRASGGSQIMPFAV